MGAYPLPSVSKASPGGGARASLEKEAACLLWGVAGLRWQNKAGFVDWAPLGALPTSPSLLVPTCPAPGPFPLTVLLVPTSPSPWALPARP